MLCLRSHVHHCISSSKGISDLLVSSNESFKFNIQILVLILKDIAMRSEGIDFSFHTGTIVRQILVAENEVVLLFSGNCELVLSYSQLGLSFQKLGGHVSVSGIGILSSSNEISFLGELSIKSSLQRMNFLIESSVIVSSSNKLN